MKSSRSISEDNRYRLDRSTRVTFSTPQAWQMATALVEYAVSKSRRGPTSITFLAGFRKDFSPKCSSSNVSASNHHNILNSWVVSGAEVSILKQYSKFGFTNR